MARMKIWVRGTGLGIALVLATVGCNNKQQAVVKPVFYPPPPDLPRIQFLTSFSDAATVTSGGGMNFRSFIVGDTSKSPTEIVSPWGLTVHDGKIYVCDVGIHRVHVIDLAARTHSFLGTPQEMRNPVNVAVASDGTRFVCDSGNKKVVVYSAGGSYIRAMGDPAKCTPGDIAIGPGVLYVLDALGCEVEVWTMDGKVLRTFARKGKDPGELFLPSNLALGPDGRVYVCDTGSSIVHVYDPRNGNYLGSIGQPGDRPGCFARPKGIAIDPAGRVFVSDSQWEVVQGFLPTGELLISFGGASPKPEGMGLPAGIDIDVASLKYFQNYVQKGFQAEYLMVVANEFGKNKIGVYAFGNSAEGDKIVRGRLSGKIKVKTVESTTQPTTQPTTRPAPAGKKP